MDRLFVVQSVSAVMWMRRVLDAFAGKAALSATAGALLLVVTSTTTGHAFGGFVPAPPTHEAPAPSAPTAPDSDAWAAGTTVITPDGTELLPAAGPAKVLGLADKRATLEAIRFALTEVADGATYVWRRQSGPLKGIVRPTSSFRDGTGRVCRHLVLGVSLGRLKRKIEGIACREGTGRWSLSG